jgi:phosphoglycerol transferase MdoB-like AlkP superfamily enzyme
MPKGTLYTPLRFILHSALFIFIFFFGYRLLFLSATVGSASEFCWNCILKSLWFGSKLDVVIISYISILPLLLVTLVYFIPRMLKSVKTILLFYYAITVISILSVTASDIPYYKFYSERMSSSIFVWIDSPNVMLDFVKGTPEYIPFFIGFLVIVTIGIILFRRQIRKVTASSNQYTTKKLILGFFLFAALTFLGMRGGLRQRPIGSRDVFTQKVQYYNHLSMNPVHHFMESFITADAKYMKNKEALSLAKNNLPEEDFLDYSPIAREVKADSVPHKYNVILILVESLSTEMVGHCGGRQNVSYFLDSMAKSSLTFTNCFAAGVHTFNGLYGSLYGMPTLPNMHPMSSSKAVNTKFNGLPGTLDNLGYNTSFFCTHDLHFDNVDYFFTSNGFDELYGISERVEDTPEDNPFGVGDEFLFDYALSEIKSISEKGDPFFTTILTISTHGPHKMGTTTSYVPQNPSAPENVYEYTDHAIKTFVNNCKKESWYDSTIFIVAGDHGFNFSSNYEIPLTYVRVPLMFFGTPVKGHISDKVASQLDIFPTTMALLGQAYTNNTFGVDLTSQNREFAVFSKDNTIGASDGKYYYLFNKFGESQLYNLDSDLPLQNLHTEEADFNERIKKYVQSIMQSSKIMIDRKVTD